MQESKRQLLLVTDYFSSQQNMLPPYCEVNVHSTNWNDKLYFSTSGNGPSRASSSSLDESGGAGDQRVVDEAPVERASLQPHPST